MANDYNVAVLGAGPGGYVAAIRAAQLGLKVAIVEKEALGGVCLNVGCIPSKALLKNAEVAFTLQRRAKEFGFKFDNLELDYEVAFKRSRQVSQRLVKGVGFLMRKHKIDVFEGVGQITGATSMNVHLDEGEAKALTADNLIIATGARLWPGCSPTTTGPSWRCRPGTSFNPSNRIMLHSVLEAQMRNLLDKCE